MGILVERAHSNMIRACILNAPKANLACNDDTHLKAALETHVFLNEHEDRYVECIDFTWQVVTERQRRRLIAS